MNVRRFQAEVWGKFMGSTELASWLYKQYWRSLFFFSAPSCSQEIKPRLSYADMAPDPSRPIGGGNVKLASLNTAFPECPKGSNILYLVSSGLSARTEAWAQACLSRGIKLVWNQNGVGYPAWAPQDYQRINDRMRRLMHRASFVIYQSEFCRRMSDKYLGVFKGPNKVIHNAVDTVVFTPQQKTLKSSQTIRFLVVGSHGDPRRFLWALETLALLRQGGVQAELDIAGRLSWPEAEKELRSTVGRLNLTAAVRFLGPFPQSAAPGLYRRADILLHLQHGDACPTVILEAMACGVPVIAPASGGIPELLGDAGVLLDAPDAEERFVPETSVVAAAVKKVLADHGRYARIARERMVERFNIKLWLQKHEAIFRDVLSRQKT
jgi:glycosyltransferase involved in cell wall biosynthesis